MTPDLSWANEEWWQEFCRLSDRMHRERYMRTARILESWVDEWVADVLGNGPESPPPATEAS